MPRNLRIEKELEIALREIGEIRPWWSKEDEMYVFEHPAYPFVMHADPDREEAKAGYMRALTGFIEDRIKGRVAPDVDRVTSGRAGARPGARRAKRSIKRKTQRINLPDDVATCLTEDPSRIEKVRALMAH
jgi:hypothetical protein